MASLEDREPREAPAIRSEQATTHSELGDLENVRFAPPGIRQDQSVDELVVQLKDTRQHRILNAIDSLKREKALPERALEEVGELLMHEDVFVRMSATDCLQTQGTRCLDVLWNLMKSGEAAKISGAAEAASHMGKLAAPLEIEFAINLQHPDDDVKVSCARALSSISDLCEFSVGVVKGLCSISNPDSLLGGTLAGALEKAALAKRLRP